MTANEQIAHRFAAQFTPPLKVGKTEAINNVRMPDAWVVSYWDAAKAVGITAVAHSGQLHAYIEAAGGGEIAEHAGQVIAKALGLFEDKGNDEAKG